MDEDDLRINLLALGEMCAAASRSDCCGFRFHGESLHIHVHSHPGNQEGGSGENTKDHLDTNL